MLVLSTVLSLIFVAGSVFTNGAPIPAQQRTEVIAFLTKFGYLAPLDFGRTRTNQELEEAVSLYQKAYGVRETGRLTKEQAFTMTHVSRCGLNDVAPVERARKRRKRYALQGTKWYKKHLTFKILNYTPDLHRNDTHSTIVTSLQMWAKAAPLTFTETTNDNADIKVKFSTRYHGDDHPFDGPGNSLAHAFFPYNNRGNAGDAHFDEEETFTLGSNTGVNLMWVAVHEFGHSLGLEHSFHPQAVMNPYYKGHPKKIRLHSDDIQGIQQLYGTPEIQTRTPTPGHRRRTPKPGVPETCKTSLDAIVYSPVDGFTYAFKGKYFWPLSDQGHFTGAMRIRHFGRRMPENIDAAVTLANKNTLFFKESWYWVFRGREYLRGPLNITAKPLNLPADLKNMDAAFRWGVNGDIYFFKDERYWRYNELKGGIVYKYPRLISVSWRGIPNNLNAAIQWKNGKSYFFKGRQYYGFDDFSTTVDLGYPRDIATYWMACSSNGLTGGKLAPIKLHSETQTVNSSANRQWAWKTRWIFVIALMTSIRPL